MTNKHFYSWTDVENMCLSISNQMFKENWKPDYIVGITRGGNVPATILSNMLGIRCETLKVSLRMIVTKAKVNYGWSKMRLVMNMTLLLLRKQMESTPKKNILIVDDINDTGATFN